MEEIKVPKDIILYIMYHMDDETLYKFCNTISPKINEICNTNWFWEGRIKVKYGVNYLPENIFQTFPELYKFFELVSQHNNEFANMGGEISLNADIIELVSFDFENGVLLFDNMFDYYQWLGLIPSVLKEIGQNTTYKDLSKYFYSRTGDVTRQARRPLLNFNKPKSSQTKTPQGSLDQEIYPNLFGSQILPRSPRSPRLPRSPISPRPRRSPRSMRHSLTKNPQGSQRRLRLDEDDLSTANDNIFITEYKKSPQSKNIRYFDEDDEVKSHENSRSNANIFL